ncbi:MAG: hypothetical protein Q9208_006233 [Pyrenodesmia sp. 3 TL-2023]
MAFAPFFRLPAELRNHVYEAYFSSLTLTYPIREPLPIILASKQLHREGRPFYWQHVRFDFLSTKHLVDFLTSIEHRDLCNLRHISVQAYPFPVYSTVEAQERGDYTTYSLDCVLHLFPGLQLSSLLVRDALHDERVEEDAWRHDTAYHSFAPFIEGDSFQELIYVFRNDRFMTGTRYASIRPPTWTAAMEWGHRDPQPSTWDAMIKQRDGGESGAGVEMYRLLDDGARRVPLGTEFETVQRAPGYKMLDGQIEIRMKRGRKARCVEKGECRDSRAQDLCALFNRLTWREIQEEGLYLDSEDDPTAFL